jgi:ATP synthase protein I
MTHKTRVSCRGQGYRLIAVQCMLVCVFALFVMALSVWQNGVALFVGGLAYSVPCLCYAHKLLENVSARAIKRVLVIFYCGELLKLVLSVALFIGLYLVFHFSLLYYLGGYMLAAFSFCIAPLFLMTSEVAA